MSNHNVLGEHMLNIQLSSATVVDGFMLHNTHPRPIEVLRLSRVINVNGGSSAAVDVRKVGTGTVAPTGTGASILSSAPISLTGQTANEPLDVALTTTRDTLVVNPGEKISFDASGTISPLAGQMTIVYRFV